MDIYVLNRNLQKIGIIDYAESIIWTTRYCNAGDFELYTAATPEALVLLKVGNGLTRSDKPDNLMIINSVRITTDEEAGDHLTISGMSAEGLIAKRIVWRQTNLSGTITECAKKLIEENLINPAIPERKISNIKMGECCKCTRTVKKQITGDNLLSAIIELLSTYKLGFKLSLNDTALTFCIYAGVDRSSHQKDRPRVIFSAEFDNLLASEYVNDASEYKNVALVAGEGEGTNRKTYAVGEASGLNRNEIYVDSRDISSETEGGTLSTAEYNELLTAKGLESLAETVIKQSFEGTIEPNANYEYGVDYNLGDIVQIENEYSITAQARITEVIEVWDTNGYSCIPTFSSSNEEV